MIMLHIFEKKINLTEDEKRIYKLLSSTILKPISDIAPYVPFGKSKTTKILQEMEHKGLIKIEGKAVEQRSFATPEQEINLP